MPGFRLITKAPSELGFWDNFRLFQRRTFDQCQKKDPLKFSLVFGTKQIRNGSYAANMKAEVNKFIIVAQLFWFLLGCFKQTRRIPSHFRTSPDPFGLPRRTRLQSHIS